MQNVWVICSAGICWRWWIRPPRSRRYGMRVVPRHARMDRVDFRERIPVGAWSPVPPPWTTWATPMHVSVDVFSRTSRLVIGATPIPPGHLRRDR
jgi:hypothetical protein